MNEFLEVKNLEKAEAMLKNIPNGIERAITGTINKALVKVKSEIKKKVSKDYNIIKKDVDKDLKIRKATFATLTGTISARYPREPIIRFLTSSSKRNTKVKIKKTEKSKVLNGKPEYIGKPFITILQNGHMGIFQRKSNERKRTSRGKNIGKKQTPIAQLYTISISEMIASESVSKYAIEQGEKYIESILEKEINRILLGYTK